MTWAEVLGSLPTDLVALIALALIVWGAIALRGQQRRAVSKIDDIREQVVSHDAPPTSLRDDVDWIKKSLDGISDNIKATRAELHAERERSIRADEDNAQRITRIEGRVTRIEGRLDGPRL